LSGDNSSPIAVDHEDSDDGDDATIKVDSSLESNESSESNAKLDAALRQAAAHAGTQRFNLDDADDAPMEIAEDEITVSFKPWASRSNQPAFHDQENIDPFSPAARNGPMPDEEDGGDDMSMDITRAIGRIVPYAPSQSPGQDDISMDLTMPLGTIKPADSKEPANRRKSLKRRASILEASKGSPAKRATSRRTSLRNRASPDDSMMDDETMDLTVAIGAIKSTALSKAKPDSEDHSDVDMSFGDETMEFTVAVGGIKGVQDAKSPGQNSDSGDDEDMSMEFTNVIGGIKNLNKLAAALDKSASPMDETAVSTPTKTKSPARRNRRSIGAGSVALPPTHVQAQTTPQRSPFRSQKTLSATPTIPPPSQQIEAFEPSPFIRRTPQSASKGSEVISTPNKKARQLTSNDIPDDPLAAPILQRRRSSLSMVQFSPLATAREEPTLKSTAVLSSNLKLLSTPRKQTLTSPMKRGLTPKKSQTPQKATTPKQKTPTPKKTTPRRGLSPKKRVAFGSEPEVQDQQDDVTEEPSEAVERISLQDFLDMTRIRFMELSTTKRRHTAAPAAFHDNEIDETDESFDRYVVAAACTLPEFELYQHACHEMKKYISEGRSFVRDLEANVMEENPLLFSEYLTAPPDQRAIMDNQFKNLKTSARLEAREKWYEWRSTLLRDLKGALLGTMEGFVQDEAVLSRQEQTLDAVLPSLGEKHTELEGVCKQLQQRHDELNSCDREELEQTREQLVATDAEIVEKRQLVAQLQEDIAEKVARIEAATDRKIECAEEIKAAERIREECRGWSTTEVNELNGKLNSTYNCIHVH
jgi:kinetochore protein Spc7/SPC105